jgi:hypothetical protein
VHAEPPCGETEPGGVRAPSRGQSARRVQSGRAIATFRITDPQPQGQPVYFQAWIDGAYPFGYSAIVPVLWHAAG